MATVTKQYTSITQQTPYCLLLIWTPSHKVVTLTSLILQYNVPIVFQHITGQKYYFSKLNIMALILITDTKNSRSNRTCGNSNENTVCLSVCLRELEGLRAKQMRFCVALITLHIILQAVLYFVFLMHWLCIIPYLKVSSYTTYIICKICFSSNCSTHVCGCLL